MGGVENETGRGGYTQRLRLHPRGNVFYTCRSGIRFSPTRAGLIDLKNSERNQQITPTGRKTRQYNETCTTRTRRRQRVSAVVSIALRIADPPCSHIKTKWNGLFSSRLVKHGATAQPPPALSLVLTTGKTKSLPQSTARHNKLWYQQSRTAAAPASIQCLPHTVAPLDD